MSANLKSRFELDSKFTPVFSELSSIFLTHDNNILCGRFGEMNLELYSKAFNASSKWSRINGPEAEDQEEFTTFVANPLDDTILLATKNNFLVRFDRRSRKVVKRWNSSHTKPITAMTLNAGSTRLATGSSDTTLRIWHIGDKEGFVASCRFHSTKITLLRFHPNKNLLFSSALAESDVTVCNSETGEKIADLKGHQRAVTDIAFDSSSADHFATCGQDKVFIIWSSSSFQKVKIVPVFECLQSISYLPVGALESCFGSGENDTSFIVTGGQWGNLRVWDTAKLQCILEIRGPTNISDPDKANLLGLGLHSISKISLFQTPSLPSHPLVLLLVRQSSHVEFYDANSLDRFHQFIGEIGPVDQLCLMGSSHDRLVLADASANLKLFSTPPGSSDHTLSQKSDVSWACQLIQGPHTEVISDIDVSSCGCWLVTGSHDMSLCLWRMQEFQESAKLPTLVPVFHGTGFHDAHISSVCFSRDFGMVFSASTDGVLKTWSVTSENNLPPSEGDFKSVFSETVLREGNSIHNAHTDAINCIHVSINDKFLATASRDKTAKIWSLSRKSTGSALLPKLMGSLVGHARGVWSVKFSDYERVALTASGDKDLRLWNLKNFTCIRTFEGHEEPVYRAEFISKGRQILSCDQKGLVRLWKASSLDGVENSVSSDTPSANVMEAHQSRIWALTVCPKDTGFYTGSEDATICYFKDRTQDLATENLLKTEEFIKEHQEFDNLLKAKKFSRALHLAVKLDKPQRACEILQEILLLEGLSPDSEKQLFSTALLGLLPSNKLAPDELPQRILKYAVNWNTRARTCLIAQRVFNWLVTNWSPEKLLSWPGFAKTIEAFIPYTVRHHQRLSRLDEQLSVLDYILDQSSVNHSNALAENAMDVDEHSLQVEHEIET